MKRQERSLVGFDAAMRLYRFRWADFSDILLLLLSYRRVLLVPHSISYAAYIDIVQLLLAMSIGLVSANQ